MKNKQKFAIVLLGALVITSLACTNVSAASPSYVGVKTGDQFIWRASLNMANINATAIALIGEENWTVGYNMLLELYKNATGMDFTGLSGAGVKVVVTNVTAEMPVTPYLNAVGLYYDLYTSWANNNWTMQVNSSGLMSPMGYLFDPNMLNASTISYAFYGMPVFMSIGLNYTMLAQAMQLMIDSSPYTAGNFTVEAQGNGLKETLLGTYIDLLISQMGLPYNITGLGDVVTTVRWNSNGVLDEATISYGGLTLATAYLESGAGGIPGYELTIFTFALGAAIIAIIYIYRKKFKFT
jgi:hypothetical protein